MGATIMIFTGEGQLNTIGNTIALGTSEADQLSGGLEVDLTFNFGPMMQLCGGKWWNAADAADLLAMTQETLAMGADFPELLRAAQTSDDWGTMEELLSLAGAIAALLEACPTAGLSIC